MYKECVVSNKKRLMEWLNTIPEDAIIVRPVCEATYMRASDKKHPNMKIRVENFFDTHIFQDPKDIKNMEAFGFIPIFWMSKDKAEANLTKLAFDMRDNLVQSGPEGKDV